MGRRVGDVQTSSAVAFAFLRIRAQEAGAKASESLQASPLTFANPLRAGDFDFDPPPLYTFEGLSDTATSRDPFGFPFACRGERGDMGWQGRG